MMEVIGINKRLFMLSLLLIFFTILGSVYADSDNDMNLQNSLSDETKYDLNDLDLSQDSSFSKESSIIRFDDSFDDFDDSDNLAENVDNVLLDDSEGFVEDVNDDLSDDSLFSGDDNLVSNDMGSKKLGVSYSNSLKSDDEDGVNSLDILPQYIKVNDSSYFTSSVIQRIIDDANPGSTIEFTDSFYKNLRLKISKPLNIISKCGTVINMTVDLPVFTISKGGAGTNITGFTINTAGSFVEARDVSNITIRNNKISAKKTAILFNNVLYSNILNNNFSSFKTAIDISRSRGINISKNNIVPDGVHNVGIKLDDISGNGGIRIYNNRIIGKDSILCTGIEVGGNVSNLIIKGNTISNWGEGIHFLNSVVNVKVHNNTLSNNNHAVRIAGGTFDRFTFTKNILSNNDDVAVLVDDDFEGTKNDPVFENNVFSGNRGSMDIQSKGNFGFKIGRNFLDAKRLCVKVKMAKGFNIKFRQDGENLYLNVLGEGGRSAQGLPDFVATANINGKDYQLLVKDGKAYLNLSGEDLSALEDASFTVGRDGRSLKDWGDVLSVSAEDLKPYILDYLESIKTQEQNQDNTNDDYNDPIDDVIDEHHEYQNNTSGSQSNSGSGSGTGTGDSGISSGSASISSGDSSAGSSGSSSPSSSASAGGSSSAAPASSAQPSATVKTLSVDDETFRVAGVGGLIVLILLVIGLYYREDIQEMMKD